MILLPVDYCVHLSDRSDKFVHGVVKQVLDTHGISFEYVQDNSNIAIDCDQKTANRVFEEIKDQLKEK